MYYIAEECTIMLFAFLQLFNEVNHATLNSFVEGDVARNIDDAAQTHGLAANAVTPAGAATTATRATIARIACARTHRSHRACLTLRSVCYAYL